MMAKALSRCSSEYQPEVILLDIGMRGLDGYETCRRIRRVLGNRVVLVALTGFGQERTRRRRRAQDSTRTSRSLLTGQPWRESW